MTNKKHCTKLNDHLDFQPEPVEQKGLKSTFLSKVTQHNKRKYTNTKYLNVKDSD